MTYQRPPSAPWARTVARIALGSLLVCGPALAAPAPAAAPAARPGAKAPWLRKNLPGTLSVVGTAGAALSVDGAPKGMLPLEPVPLKAGKHTLELRREGFATLKRRVTVKPGEEALLTLELKPLQAAGSLALQGEPELPPLIAAGVPLPPPASDEDGPGGTLKGVVIRPPVPVGQAPEPAAEAPLIVVEGELVRAGSAPAPVAPPRPPLVLEANPALVDAKAPGQAFAAPPEAVVAGGVQAGPITKQWWFWGGVGAAALVVVAGVVYALPPTYVESRNPAAGCGGACGVVVNK